MKCQYIHAAIKLMSFEMKFIDLHSVRCCLRYFDWKRCRMRQLVRKQMVQVFDPFHLQLNHALQAILPSHRLIVNCKIRWHRAN